MFDPVSLAVGGALLAVGFCRQYTGPRPVETLFTTPILPPRD